MCSRCRRAREAVWTLLTDIPRVVPCIPGATLTDAGDNEEWRAEFPVSLGPVAMVFDANITREVADEPAALSAWP
jgi:carbon monoxide dehydrogenase subunit G